MKRPAHRVQYAALPYRWIAGGEVEILLVTSRRSKRWIIPKGWPMPRKPPHRAAALEALEEAGVTGSIATKPLGSYRCRKRLKDGEKVVCRVEVFALKVSDQLERWPDEGKREVKWFAPARAAALVREPLLRAMILGVAGGFAEARTRSARKKIWVDHLRALFERTVAETPRAAPDRAAQVPVGLDGGPGLLPFFSHRTRDGMPGQHATMLPCR
jgi:8-oxo-dGTP pyrophosphatase MutT (NUDIX family)